MSDSVLEHLRQVTALPDLAGTRYELDSEIGRGGMGVVYAARDRELDRRVALKVLEVPLAGEAQLIARLEHPAVVPVFETGTLVDGRSFYAMKLVSGGRLDHYAAGEHTLSERLRVIRRVGEALAFAHSRGVIHRDLKPQNVMVGEFGEVYVMDWGVEAVAGTPGFRAPESTLGELSDIYSLGALLKFLLSSSASGALAAVAQKSMNADPRGRYPSVSALLADIDRFEQGRAVQAWSEPVWHRVQRFAVRNAVLLWLLAAYTLVKFLLFFWRKF
ncbi:MAG TPA: serine/threonine-protein kinase [Candidatus Binatia bacterium]|nr:serine/threonine-protein kinase [Candidatus Binatia bacterium]